MQRSLPSTAPVSPRLGPDMCTLPSNSHRVSSRPSILVRLGAIYPAAPEYGRARIVLLCCQGRAPRPSGMPQTPSADPAPGSQRLPGNILLTSVPSLLTWHNQATIRSTGPIQATDARMVEPTNPHSESASRNVLEMS